MAGAFLGGAKYGVACWWNGFISLFVARSAPAECCPNPWISCWPRM
jgi:hypothetical protein